MMTRGRHAMPSKTAENLRRAAVTAVASPLVLSGGGAALADEAPTSSSPAPAPAPAPPAADAPAPALDVVVQRGDTISGLAVMYGICGPGADVETCWTPLYDQNRDVVGDNPDLIYPGQALHYVGGLLLPTGTPQVVTEAPAEPEQVTPDPAPEIQSGGSAIIANSAGPVKPETQAGADAVFNNVPGASLITIGGTRASAIDPKGHPSGKALDFMVLGDQSLGDAIVSFNVAHWDELDIEYIIYRQRILMSPGGSWQPMEDRGSPTANHMDHVHVNYR